MLSIKFDTGPFLKSMRAARARFAVAVISAVRRYANLTAARARASTLFKSNTGKLRSSISATFPGTYEGKVDATARHAVWVERGNGFRNNAQYIYPKHAPMLVFHINGHKIVARRVRTTKPRPFMAEAAKTERPFFEQACRDTARNMFT